MPTPSHRAAHHPRSPRNFGRIHDEFPVPDLTEIQTRSYERFLQADVPPEERDDSGLEGGLPRDLPDRELRQDAQARIHQVRPGQAPLRARRVPPAPPDLRPAAARLAPPEQGRDGHRGVGLPRRHADHDRRRRVHHQRRRARRRQPAPPLARRRLRRRDRGRRQEAARLPGHPRARKLDRAAGHQEGHPGRPDRPVGQVLVDDAAAGDEPRVLLRRGDPVRPSTRPRRSPTGDPNAAARLEGRIACGDVVDPNTGEVLVESGATISKTSAAGARRRRPRRRSRSSRTPSDPLILQSLQEDPTDRPRERAAADLPAAPAGQPAAAGEGPRAVPREVLRHQPLPPRQGRPVPDQPQVQPGRPRRPDDPGRRSTTSTRSATSSTSARGKGPRRRHRPPGQPPSADDRRAGRRRAPQGLPQAPPHRPGADEPQGRRGHDPAQPDQPQEHQRGDRVLLRPRRAVAGRRPDQPAGPAHPRAAALGAWAPAA